MAASCRGSDFAGFDSYILDRREIAKPWQCHRFMNASLRIRSRNLMLRLPVNYGSKRVSRLGSRFLTVYANDRLGNASITSCSEQMLQQLESQMQEAVAREDYLEAASTRDTISMLLEQDPTLKLKSMMKKAIEEERYEDAATYQKQLDKMMVKPKPGPKCSSDVTTQGIRVQVRSVYVNERSQPYKRQYFFAYRIRISNLSNRPVQLLNRHWIITDENGRIEHVRGPGVVGEQPVLLPGTNFEYTSACPLATATGTMEGDYEMRYVDESGLVTFSVKIGLFDLAMQN